MVGVLKIFIFNGLRHKVVGYILDFAQGKEFQHDIYLVYHAPQFCYVRSIVSIFL
jgi:hypothetical protein